jgi:hypothetical protein
MLPSACTAVDMTISNCVYETSKTDQGRWAPRVADVNGGVKIQIKLLLYNIGEKELRRGSYRWGVYFAMNVRKIEFKLLGFRQIVNENMQLVKSLYYVSDENKPIWQGLGVVVQSNTKEEASYSTLSHSCKADLLLIRRMSTVRRVRKFAKSDLASSLSFRPSALNSSAPTGQIFMKFGIEYFFFFESLSRNSSFIKIQQG